MAVAYSGGRDSTALLHATLGAAGPLGLKVVALHVHHGLSLHADHWLGHCQSQVLDWQRRGHALSLSFERLSGRPTRGQSVEAWARDGRYQALGRMARSAGAGVVLLAHHQRDQAETLLLQALRGAGVAGLAGMPSRMERAGIVWLRPWLDRPREDIEAHVRRHRLTYVDDESNLDPRFARNRLRLQVWPVLSEAFAGADASLAGAARWAQQAHEGLKELAGIDLASCADAQGLRIASWRPLSPVRRSNALRSWLQQQSGRPAPASLVLRLLDELPLANSARWQTPGGWLQCQRGCLSWAAVPNAESVDLARQTTAAPPAQQSRLTVRRAGRFRLHGWSGCLRITRVREGGVPFAWLDQVDLKPRQGGEQFQSGIGRPARSLKKQYQAAGVPEWHRSGPLVYSGGQLVFVPGLGIDARALALPGQAQAMIAWLPDEGPH